jgi:DNA-binding SARP family transcriptional activator
MRGRVAKSRDSANAEPMVLDPAPVVTAKVRIPQLHALRLDRLEARLAGVWDQRLGLVVAPAGSGKTTLIAGFAAALDARVAWYRAEGWDAPPRILLRHLHRAFAAAIGGPSWDSRPWETVEAAAEVLEDWDGERMLLVVDDLHTLEGTEAEAVLERLIDYAPRSVAVLAASRTQPGFNLSRRRVSDGLLEIGSDDLRFRSWEVERLFRDVYGEAIPPDELAVLARRTEGWAAGLQFFHLAIQGKSADERRRLLAGGGANARLVNEYLARNVLADLPGDMLEFLVDTSVLGRLSGSLCDALLGRADSQSVLEELERRQIFTTQLDDEGAYRYHEVLRSHLESMLLRRYGEDETRARYRKAGELLARTEEMAEALGAFARAGEWAIVQRLLGSWGERLVDGRDPWSWFDVLAPAVVRHDPWLALAHARGARDDGHWAEAIEAFAQAEQRFGAGEAAATARRERQALAAWMTPMPVPVGDWSTLLRSAVARDPLSARRAASALPAPASRLVAGLASLLAGRVIEARDELTAVSEHAASTPAIVAGAALGAAIAAFLAGDPAGNARLEVAAHSAERARTGWLALIARAASILAQPDMGRSPLREAESLLRSCTDNGDRWGELLIRLFEGWARLSSPSPARAGDVLEPAIPLARALGAGVLEAMARSLHALAKSRVEMSDAREAAIDAELFARTVGAPGARLLAYLALAEADPSSTDDVAFSDAASGEWGVVPPPRHKAIEHAPVVTGADPPLAIRCFGVFELEVGGRLVDHRRIRPRARSLLHFLAIHAGAPVHREVIEGAIWPTGDSEPGPGRLHVAVSSIRRLLEPDATRGHSTYLVRDGDAYRLTLPPGAVVDTIAFDEAILQARVARRRRDPSAAAAAYARAVELHRGDLLVEEGPAEWVLERRAHYRGLAVEAAQALAELSLAAGDPAGAANACTAGLEIERYHDPLWRLLIEARELAGDRIAATRARDDYRQMLADLGLDPAEEAGTRLTVSAAGRSTAVPFR